MKLMRHGPKGAEKPALVDATGQVRDLSGVLADINAATLSPQGLDRLRALDATEATLMIEPPPRSSMPGSTARMAWNMLRALRLNEKSHAASSHSSTVPACT